MRPTDDADTQPLFEDRLREALKTSGFTQEGLAREIDASLRTVQYWLSGRMEPKGRQLLRLAAALGREPGWFFPEPEKEAA